MKKEKYLDYPSNPRDPEYDELLDPPATAKFLGGSTPFSVGTLAVWRWKAKRGDSRYDLKPVYVGRYVRYRKSVVREWRDNHDQSPM